MQMGHCWGWWFRGFFGFFGHRGLCEMGVVGIRNITWELGNVLGCCAVFGAFKGGRLQVLFEGRGQQLA